MANIKDKTSNNVIKAAVFGSLIGAVTGLLLAPKKGLELRQDIAGQAHKMGERAVGIKDKAQSAWQSVEGKTQETVTTSKSWIQKGKKLVSNLNTLISEIRNGALTKTCSNNALEDKNKDEDKDSVDPIDEI